MVWYWAYMHGKKHGTEHVNKESRCLFKVVQYLGIHKILKLFYVLFSNMYMYIKMSIFFVCVSKLKLMPCHKRHKDASYYMKS